MLGVHRNPDETRSVIAYPQLGLMYFLIIFSLSEKLLRDVLTSTTSKQLFR